MMDKNLHDDIGDLFYDEIEALSQRPQKQVWENIEHELDKTDAGRYKKKFNILKRVAAVLFFLLLGFATCTVIYFNNKKNSNKEVGNIAGNNTAGNTSQPLNNDTLQKGIHENNPGRLLISKANTKIIELHIAKDTAIKKTDEEKVNDIYLNKTENIYEYKADFSLAGSSNKRNEYHGAHSNAEPVELLFLKKAVNNKTNAVKLPEQFFPVISITNRVISINENKPASENNKKTDALYNRFFLTAFAAPEFAGYNLEEDEMNGYDNKQDIASREKPDISFSAGILMGYDISKRITLQSGICFSVSNIKIDPSIIYAEKTNAGNIKYRYNTSSGYGYILPSFGTAPVIGDSLNTTKADHTLQYLSIPVMVKYRVDNSRFSFYAGGGVAVNFLTKAVLNTEVADAQNREKESIVKLQGLKKVSYSLLLAPEMQYRLSNKWSLSATPYFKYALSPINKGNLVKTYPYNIGLGIGVVRKF